MSSIGTGVATSVAQVAQNAQQTARARSKAGTDTQRAAQADAVLRLQRLQAPGAANDPDAELPDRQAPGYEQLYFTGPDGQPLPDPHPLTSDPTPGGDLPDHAPTVINYGPHAQPAFPLYQHLDVRG